MARRLHHPVSLSIKFDHLAGHFLPDVDVEVGDVVELDVTCGHECRMTGNLHFKTTLVRSRASCFDRMSDLDRIPTRLLHTSTPGTDEHAVVMVFSIDREPVPQSGRRSFIEVIKGTGSLEFRPELDEDLVATNGDDCSFPLGPFATATFNEVLFDEVIEVRFAYGCIDLGLELRIKFTVGSRFQGVHESAPIPERTRRGCSSSMS